MVRDLRQTVTEQRALLRQLTTCLNNSTSALDTTNKLALRLVAVKVLLEKGGK